MLNTIESTTIYRGNELVSDRLSFCVPVKEFKNLIDIAKKIKSQIIYAYVDTNLPNMVGVCGFDDTLNIFKTIVDESGKMPNMNIVDFAIRMTTLNQINKLIEEAPIDRVTFNCFVSGASIVNPYNGMTTREFIFVKEIICGDIIAPTLPLQTINQKVQKINLELQLGVHIFNQDLTNDERFISILESKAGDGLSNLIVGDTFLMISPSIVSVQKGDSVYVDIYLTNIGKLARFTVVKPKKKCTIYTTLRAMNIKRQT